MSVTLYSDNKTLLIKSDNLIFMQIGLGDNILIGINEVTFT